MPGLHCAISTIENRHATQDETKTPCSPMLRVSNGFELHATIQKEEVKHRVTEGTKSVVLHQSESASHHPPFAPEGEKGRG